jgi:hypothetical protein
MGWKITFRMKVYNTVKLGICDTNLVMSLNGFARNGCPVALGAGKPGLLD